VNRLRRLFGLSPRFHRFCSECGRPMEWTETGQFATGIGTPLRRSFDVVTGQPVESGWQVYACTAAPLASGHDMVWGEAFTRPRSIDGSRVGATVA
jgi:hypothetical protein